MNCSRCGIINLHYDKGKLKCSCGQVYGPAREVERIFKYGNHICVVVLKKVMHHRCGYVIVDGKSPLSKRHYRDLDDVVVHGGLTFCGDASQLLDVPYGTSAWCFGFDCLHAGDAPDDVCGCERYGEPPFPVHFDGHVYTMHEVELECIQLSEQLAKLEGKLS